MNLPSELQYTKEHEWVRSDNEQQVTIGITDFAQSELGDIVFVELPEVGLMVKAGDPFGSVESVKTVSELYSPVSGKIIKVNGELIEEPEKANEAPYTNGWMIVVELNEVNELHNLLSASDYQEFVQE